nr:immunoglobulin heavy chain junction region [Macaca mulatta]MOV48998.1 immunoglobulin heavy chain junction region [Macaca mulatta]MOV50054.1 immunoglobulin heavy chain junction region [Macaca mulatta]MOV50640.1 immunoglobulin heavy chain junction region [Macaca mulatta]MOV50922.1 immunoglobulin heavy chain junction region [Macaca mulatta]
CARVGYDTGYYTLNQW